MGIGLLIAAGLAGCGPAAIGVGLGSAGGGGGGNAPATVSALALADAKGDTSRILCTVSDVEGDAVAVTFSYALPDGVERMRTYSARCVGECSSTSSRCVGALSAR